MRKKSYQWALWTALLGTMVVLTGCGKSGIDTANDGEGSEIVIEESTENPQKEETKDTSEQTGMEGNPRKPLYEGTPYTWNEITVTIPDAWKDQYTIEESESGFYFLQKASAEKEEGMGYLCGFSYSDGPTYEMAGERLLAYTDSQMYYMTVPTDVSFYYEDETISAEYQEMSQYVVAMGESIQVEKEGVHYDPREYLFPMSNVLEIDAGMLSNYNDNDLWIARNEMFARHGLRFESAYLQEHFDACSWYEGTVEPEQLDESVFSDVEKTNLELIKQAEAEYQKQHPYPMKKQVGENVICDLDENGIDETLCYKLTEVEKDGYTDYEASFIIDDMVFDLGDYKIDMINPETSDYYLTDISPYFEGLEIAVVDYGPSDDLETYFFSYDGSLHFMGSVEGFPFKEKGTLNGFGDAGAVRGVIRTDIICSCYGYANWWYDYENKELVYQDTGYYQMLPTGAHELFMDLPVYHDMNTESLQTTIPAQKEVYFTLTDGKEWIEVKGKDGTRGFVHILDEEIEGLGKKAEDVFSNLPLFD